MSWASRHFFPESKDVWSVYYPLVARAVAGEERVKKAFRRPNLLEPLLVSSPMTEGRYLPPLAIDGPAGDAAREYAIRQRRYSKYIVYVYTPLLAAVLWYLTDVYLTASWLAFGVVVASYLHYDTSSLQSPRVLQERALFYGWMFCQSRRYIAGSATFFAGIGLIQLALNYRFGSNEATLERFGLLYSSVSGNGEWWRLLTGPFLHHSLAHWLGNLAIGLGLFALCGPLLRGRLPLLVTMSAIGSFVTVYAAHGVEPNIGDGIIGLSGGLGGLLGWLVVSALRFPKLYPRHFFLTASYFALITLILFPAFTSVGTLICHASGMTLGGIVALFSGKPSFASASQDSPRVKESL